ncbi:MAG: hypothetical protein HYV07_02545 [Deltaproteobacteria bacterium]|nr:hypothetical protein [Deltaproteobacteria bacterium]
MSRVGALCLVVVFSTTSIASAEAIPPVALTTDPAPAETGLVLAESGVGLLAHFAVTGGLSVLSLISFLSMCMFGCESEETSSASLTFGLLMWTFPPLASSAVVYGLSTASDDYETFFLPTLGAGLVTQGALLFSGWMLHRNLTTPESKDRAITLSILLSPVASVAAEVLLVNLTKERSEPGLLSLGPSVRVGMPVPVPMGSVGSDGFGISIPVSF